MLRPILLSDWVLSFFGKRQLGGPLRAGRSSEPTRSAVLVFWGSSPPCRGLFYFWPSFFNSFLNTFLVSSFFFQKRLLGRMDPRFCLWIK